MSHRAPAKQTRHRDWAEVTVTRRCNQRCFFCYEDVRDGEPEPELDQIKALIDKVSEHAQLVVLCGKEALLRPDIGEVIDHAVAVGLQVSAFTNGRVLSRDGLVERIAEAGLRSLQVSFHFPDPETYARGTRTSERGFERVIRGLVAVDKHNRRRRRSRITVFTETDMFVMNSGRLVGMRDLLLGALGESLGGMRLGCLLPTPIHDIGLSEVLEPLATRRQELKTFIEGHPPKLGLEFVKLPLCLIPAYEHLAKGVSYLQEGTVLTHNHEALERLSFDRTSTSASRDVVDALRSSPYRWICRSCPLVAMCRFERVAWAVPFFEPTRGQRPIPPSATEPSEVFARIDSGDAREVVQAVEDVKKCLEGVRFPEEDILSALTTLNGLDGEPRLVDAYVHREPIIAVELQTDSSIVALHIRPPSLETPSVGAIVDILDVHCLNERESSKDDIEVCLRALAKIELPPIEAWAGEEWFDPTVGRLFRSTWQCLGERSWTGLGRFADWVVMRAKVGNGPELAFGLRNDSANISAELRIRDRSCCRGVGGEPCREVAVIIDGNLCGALAQLEELLDSISTVVEGGRAKRSIGPRDLERHSGTGVILKLDAGRWCFAGPIDRKVSSAVRLVLHDSHMPHDENWLEVSLFDGVSPHWLRVGDLTLSYGPGALTVDLERLARGLEVAMRTGRSYPITATSAAAWSLLTQMILEKVGLAEKYELQTNVVERSS